MAGEWLQVDCNIDTKPETLELIDATGLEPALVVGRLVMLWKWSSLNCEDGQARISLRLLSKLCGGDESFWLEVERVGWLVVDAENGTVAVPGWDRRFSKAAKSRALAAVRHQLDKAGGAERPRRGRSAPPRGARSALERRDRRDRISSSSLPVADASQEAEADTQPEAAGGPQEAAGPSGWETLRKAWAAGTGRPWKLPDPPDKAADRLDEDGWFQKALAAIAALPRCKYFADPVTLPQFVAPGFVDKVLGGQFDNPRRSGGGGYRAGQDDKPPLTVWSGEDAEAFERTKRRLAEQIMAAEAGT